MKARVLIQLFTRRYRRTKLGQPGSSSHKIKIFFFIWWSYALKYSTMDTIFIIHYFRNKNKMESEKHAWYGSIFRGSLVRTWDGICLKSVCWVNLSNRISPIFFSLLINPTWTYMYIEKIYIFRTDIKGNVTCIIDYYYQLGHFSHRIKKTPVRFNG